MIDLGQIVNGKLIENIAPYKFRLPIKNECYSGDYVPDSRTSIISEGWKVNPYEVSKDLKVTYTRQWTGLDLYKASISGRHTVESTYEVKKTMGFEADGELTRKEAEKFGLKISGSATATSRITEGTSFDVPAWTKMCKRPYIYEKSYMKRRDIT